MGIPVLHNGKGESQADAVYNLIKKWKIEKNVQFMSFYTTASNTGNISGACKLLQNKLGRPLIELACRHHIIELLLSKVFKITIENVTVGPEVKLFQKFQEFWCKIDSAKYDSVMNDTELAAMLSNEKISLIIFITNQLSTQQPQLCAIFLGNKETNWRFHSPGAFHRARWMAKIIYCFKIYLFRNQFPLTELELNGIRQFLFFCMQNLPETLVFSAEQ